MGAVSGARSARVVLDLRDCLEVLETETALISAPLVDYVVDSQTFGDLPVVELVRDTVNVIVAIIIKQVYSSVVGLVPSASSEPHEVPVRCNRAPGQEFPAEGAQQENLYGLPHLREPLAVDVGSP